MALCASRKRVGERRRSYLLAPPFLWKIQAPICWPRLCVQSTTHRRVLQGFDFAGWRSSRSMPCDSAALWVRRSGLDVCELLIAELHWIANVQTSEGWRDVPIAPNSTKKWTFNRYPFSSKAIVCETYQKIHDGAVSGTSLHCVLEWVEGVRSSASPKFPPISFQFAHCGSTFLFKSVLYYTHYWLLHALLVLQALYVLTANTTNDHHPNILIWGNRYTNQPPTLVILLGIGRRVFWWTLEQKWQTHIWNTWFHWTRIGGDDCREMSWWGSLEVK